MKGTIVIIDGNSLINRAYYAMQRPMITKEGIYTQGIYGFINMLTKIQSDYEPEYLTVAFDLKAPTFRHLEYAEYKAGRKSMPPELVMQMPLMKEVLGAMNIKILELEGFEADDIIGTIAKKGEEEGLNPLIITGDRDALQLVSDKTEVLITKKGITDFEIYTPDKMSERYGLTPSQFIDLKGLMGDSSDNIPGIPGVGEKTGIKLLEQFGSIENILNNTEQISAAKLRQKVEENAHLAVLSKRLATINVNVPLDVTTDELKLTEPDYDRLIDLYTKLEFNSFLKKLNMTSKSEVAVIETIEINKEIIDKEDNLSKLKNLNKNIYLKIFGDYNHIRKPRIDGALLMDEKNAFYIDLTDIEIQSFVAILNEIGFEFWGHDLKDDLYSLMTYGLINFGVQFDTAVSEYVIDPSKNNYDLKNLALEKLHVDIDQADSSSAGEQLDFFADGRITTLDNGVKVASVVKQLMEISDEKIKTEGLEMVFNEVELPLIEVMAAMEVEGVKVNGEFLNDFGIDLKERITDLEKEIYELAECEFNINSPQQLGNVLFENLGLPFGKKTKRGYSTSADILEKIKDKHPIVEKVLVYRNLAKLNSTYVEGMKPLICEDGKIRAHFQQTVTATGRISCTEPNLQNIPVRQELGRNLRKAFTAEDENRVLIGADYSQIELRVLAHLSQDEALIDAFNKGEDIHKLTASRVLGIPFEEVTALERSRAKAVNFGVIYGMSGFGLSENLQISRKEAEKYIEDYFSKHIKVKQYMDNQIASCKEKGFSETIMGRKRPIHEITSSAFMVRQLGERLAMNSPIQGSAADIIKLAMIKVYNTLKNDYPDAKLLLQVHDELIISVPKEKTEMMKSVLKRSMESAIELSVKMIADVNDGFSWYDLK